MQIRTGKALEQKARVLLAAINRIQTEVAQLQHFTLLDHINSHLI